MTATVDPVAAWWEGGSGQPLYLRLRKLDSRGLQSAVESLPEYDGPTAVPATRPRAAARRRSARSPGTATRLAGPAHALRHDRALESGR